MKGVNLALILLAIPLLGGCASVDSIQAKNMQSNPYPEEPFTHAKDEAWFSTGELVNRAERYVRQNNVPFDLDGSDVALYVNAAHGPALVRVSFLHEIGGDVCNIWFDRQGVVLKHSLGKAVD